MWDTGWERVKPWVVGVHAIDGLGVSDLGWWLRVHPREPAVSHSSPALCWDKHTAASSSRSGPRLDSVVYRREAVEGKTIHLCLRLQFRPSPLSEVIRVGGLRAEARASVLSHQVLDNGGRVWVSTAE